MALISFGANAGLDDAFVFSSKFGLTTESVTTKWQTEENGLIYGGQVNGVPSDTWHNLFYYNGRFASVVIGYQFEPLYFETEQAARRWSSDAVRSLIEKANRKYGEPHANTLKCDDELNAVGCSGSVVWRGSKKVFEVRAAEIVLPELSAAHYGFPTMAQMTFSYTATEDYDLFSVRLPSLIDGHNKRLWRRNRQHWNRLWGRHLARTNQSLDDFLLEKAQEQGKINEILRKDSVMYIGGVKANYKPERWARAFMLQ